VSIVAHYIKERAKDGQFICISLRNVRVTLLSLFLALDGWLTRLCAAEHV